MKRLLMLACLAGLAVALQGCAVQQPLETTQPRAMRAISAGTLAKAGTCEVDVAPAYTRLILSRQRAAGMTLAGRLTRQQALEVLAGTDEIRAQLDRACAGGKLDAQLLDQALHNQRVLNLFLENPK